MEGGGDPDNRRPTNWEDASEDVRDRFGICKLFIRLRREHPALANDGTFEWMDHRELLIIKRCVESEELYVAVNSREYEPDTVLPEETEFVNLIDGALIGKNVYFGRLGFMLLKKLS